MTETTSTNWSYPTARTLRVIGTYGGAFLLALWSVLPLYWLMLLSLTPKFALLRDEPLLWPHPVTGSNYSRLVEPGFGQVTLIREGFLASLVVAGIVTTGALLLA